MSGPTPGISKAVRARVTVSGNAYFIRATHNTRSITAQWHPNAIPPRPRAPN